MTTKIKLRVSPHWLWCDAIQARGQTGYLPTASGIFPIGVCRQCGLVRIYDVVEGEVLPRREHAKRAFIHPGDLLKFPLDGLP
jgi:hypothetical protein